jgi:hypothetical protein
MLNRDYKEILQILLENKVNFLVVGAYAMAAYGYPRATGDLDLWVESTFENSRRIYHALSEFGVPLSDITEETFTEKGIVFQIGMAPRRIDILTSIDGVEFRKASRDKKIIEVENINIPFLSKVDLIKNKKASGRERDRLDLKFLQDHSAV